MLIRFKHKSTTYSVDVDQVDWLILQEQTKPAVSEAITYRASQTADRLLVAKQSVVCNPISGEGSGDKRRNFNECQDEGILDNKTQKFHIHWNHSNNMI